MLYFPRKLALVVGLAGPAAGFASIKGGSTLLEFSIEGASPNYVRPDLKCCRGDTFPEDPDGELPKGCFNYTGRIDECLPHDLCERIGRDQPSSRIVGGNFVPGGTIQT